MSIIYDALKKTENIIQADLKLPLETKPKQSKPKFKIIVLYVIMVCLGLVIGNIIFGFLNHPVPKLAKNNPALSKPPLKETVKPLQKIDTSLEPQATTAPLITPAPAPVKPEPQKPYILNGIFSSYDEGYALVNNKIVKVGDKVDAATVLRITADEVELNASGTVIKLSRPR